MSTQELKKLNLRKAAHTTMLLGALLTLSACIYTTYSEEIFEVAPQTVKCEWGFGGYYHSTLSTAIDCVQLRQSGSTDFYPSMVSGFQFEPGFTYQIRVRIATTHAPVPDGGSSTLELISILSKK